MISVSTWNLFRGGLVQAAPVALADHSVDHEGFGTPKIGRDVTKFKPDEALKLIAQVKLTFDERVVLHRAVCPKSCWGVRVFVLTHRFIPACTVWRTRRRLSLSPSPSLPLSLSPSLSLSRYPTP